MNKKSVDNMKEEDFTYILKSFEKEITLLVIDQSSSIHYKQLVEFRKKVIFLNEIPRKVTEAKDCLIFDECSR